MPARRIITGRRLAWAALLVAAGAVAFGYGIGRQMPDFQVYRVAAARAVAGEPLYRAADGHWQFKYLPAFAFVMAPVTLLPAPASAQTPEPRRNDEIPWADTGRVAWFWCSAALLVLMLALSMRLLPSRSWPAPAIIGLALLALGKFYARELTLGQTNVLLTVVVLLAVARLRSAHSHQAGALFAAATIVKPYAVLFLPYLLARRHGRAAAAFIAVLLAALLLPALRYGFGGNLALLSGWWTTVSSSTAPNLTVSDNVSIAAMYAKWLGTGDLARWLAVGSAALLIGHAARVLIPIARVPFPEYLDCAVLLALIPLLSPQGWDYVLLLATPAVMLLVNRIGAFSRPIQGLALAALMLVGLTLFDIVGRRAYAAFMASSAVTICYLFAVELVIRLRARQLA